MLSILLLNLFTKLFTFDSKSLKSPVIFELSKLVSITTAPFLIVSYSLPLIHSKIVVFL